MAKFNTYLNFPGTTEEAFNFYKSVFGGEFSAIMRYGDMPGCDGEATLSDEDKQKIMHISLPLGGDTVLMATDSLGSMGQNLVVGNNSYIYIDTKSKDEADRLYQALSEGGKVEMAIADTFWGSYWGCFADKFGTGWMIGYDEKPQ